MRIPGAWAAWRQDGAAAARPGALVRQLGTIGAALLILGALIPLAACASKTPGLEDTEWRVTSWADESLDPADFELTASFADGEVGGRSAVNSYGGSYRATATGEFSVGMLTQTLMAGPEPAMRAETAFLGFLQGAATYEREGRTLTLRDGDGRVLMIFARID